MTESDEARAWAVNRGWTAYEVAERTGYSYEAVYWFWRGCTPPNRNIKTNSKSRKIKPNVWQRFKIACSGAEREAKSGKKFGW
jgi:hypothetical protein